MQADFQTKLYTAFMSTQTQPKKSRLQELREAAGLSIRELARQVEEDHSNVRYWENSGKPPRSDKLIPLANALGVTVEELLGADKPQRAVIPGGKLGQVFASVSQLPRRQQDKVIEFVEAFVEKKSAS